MSRPMTVTDRQGEERAYDATMRIFERYGCDPRKDNMERISATMKRMTVKEIECVATAQRYVMALNGIHGGMRLDG